MNFTEKIEAFAKQDIFECFMNGEALLHLPVFQRVLEDNGIMGYHGIPQMPVFIYKAIADELNVIADTDALVQRYSEAEVNILY
jgi:hypothetical protein